MNSFVAESYIENIQRLALGLDPLDAMQSGRIARPIRIELENRVGRRSRHDAYRRSLFPGSPLPVISRHDSCLQAMLYHPGLAEHVDLLLYDHGRHYVPRRLRIPILTIAQAESQPFTQRVRRPALFPGAAYDVSPGVSGLRGRVLRDGIAMRWARIEAHLPDSDTLVGRAQGDDRGEFLLVIAPHTFAELEDPFNLRVTVSAPSLSPVPDTPQLPLENRFWDLPLEVLPAAGMPDQVSTGVAMPTGYVSALSATRIVPFRLGRMLSLSDGLQDFNFSP